MKRKHEGARAQRTQSRPCALVGAKSQRGPRPMVKAPVLLAAVLVVCVASSADARRRHNGYGGGYDSGERYSTRSSLDAWRRARDAQQGQDQDQPREQDRPRGDERGQELGQNGEDRSRYDRRRARDDDRRVRDEWRLPRERR